MPETAARLAGEGRTHLRPLRGDGERVSQAQTEAHDKVKTNSKQRAKINCSERSMNQKRLWG